MAFDFDSDVAGNRSLTDSLAAPDPVQVKQELRASLAVPQAKVDLLQKKADENVSAVFSMNMNDISERTRLINQIEAIGRANIQSTGAQDKVLASRLKDLSRTTEGGAVANALVELSGVSKQLDPSGLNFDKSGFLGKLTNPLRQYFQRYERSDKIIQQILQNLESGERTLREDNKTLEISMMTLHEKTKQLETDAVMVNQFNEELEAAVSRAKMEGYPEQQIKFVEEEILFTVKQKQMELNERIIVNQQSIIAMELVRRNNKELIRGAEKAKFTTLTALKTAVMVASALADQKIVLNAVNAINQTTSDIILANSRLIKEQGTAIQKQAVQSSLNMENLKEAMGNLFSALDDISRFKQEALPAMTRAVTEFEEMASAGSARIQSDIDARMLES
ncbi:MAG: toxic anion resistance protein [Clostridiales bacterium]|jgi:uncharacterized protein YaaN involved in tellurite resistance|nr:toxic anion resistance protein [Clostridiales bacterium]